MPLTTAANCLEVECYELEPPINGETAESYAQNLSDVAADVLRGNTEATPEMRLAARVWLGASPESRTKQAARLLAEWNSV